jgi:DNA-binding beta-propeller fold protein YncE
MKSALRTLLAAAAALVAGCASAPPPRPQVVWPDPPEVARIRFVTAFRSSEDLDQSGWGKFKRGLLGGGTADVGVSHPMGLALSDDGQRLYIADLRGSQVLLADFQKRTVERFAPGESFPLPFNVALDADENVYVSDSAAKTVMVFTRQGQRLRIFGPKEGLERPTGLAVDRQRRLIYVADTSHSDSPNHRVFAYTLEGRVVREVGRGRGSEDGAFNFPSYLALDNAGNLYVNDSMNFRVQVFDPEGKFVKAYGKHGDSPGSFGRMKGLAFDAFENLYVADGEHAVVQIFNKSFDPLMYFGGNRPDLLEYFDIPSGIAIDKKTNRIYVGNQLNARINVYELINTKPEDSRTDVAAAPAAPAAPGK